MGRHYCLMLHICFQTIFSGCDAWIGNLIMYQSYLLTLGGMIVICLPGAHANRVHLLLFFVFLLLQGTTEAYLLMQKGKKKNWFSILIFSMELHWCIGFHSAGFWIFKVFAKASVWETVGDDVSSILHVEISVLSYICGSICTSSPLEESINHRGLPAWIPDHSPLMWPFQSSGLHTSVHKGEILVLFFPILYVLSFCLMLLLRRSWDCSLVNACFM